MHCRQGVHNFLRAYYHHKSADWAENKPYRLAGWTAEELAKMPTYYIMEAGETMAGTVAKHMPTPGQIAVPIAAPPHAPPWAPAQAPAADVAPMVAARVPCSTSPIDGSSESACHWFQAEVTAVTPVPARVAHRPALVQAPRVAAW